jgi:hypothetical protein
VPDNVIWAGPEHGDGETLLKAFRRITGRDLDLSRCLFEDVRGAESTFVFRDGLEVTIRFGGECTISRAGEGGGGGAG